MYIEENLKRLFIWSFWCSMILMQIFVIQITEVNLEF